MTSALACVGLAVSDKDELQWLVASAHRAIRQTGIFDGVHVGRWQDDSGAALILGWQSGELLDFAPAYTAASGELLAGCRLINDSVAIAKVVDADGRQLTAMTFEAEQYRHLLALGQQVSGPARITALSVDVSIYPDADAFAASPGSQLRPSPESGPEPPPHYRENGWSWPPRLGAESLSPTASLPTPPRPGRVPSCPAPSWTPPAMSARSPDSPSSSPPSARRDSRIDRFPDSHAGCRVRIFAPAGGILGVVMGAGGGAGPGSGSGGGGMWHCRSPERSETMWRGSPGP